MSFFRNGKYRNEPDDCIVYVEKYNKQSKSVLIDFLDSNEFVFFNSIAQLNYNWENLPTMVEILNYSQRSVKEGSTYSMSIKSILLLIERIQIVQNSLIIGFRITLNLNDPILFLKSKPFSLDEKFFRNIILTDNSELPEMKLDFGVLSKVIIRNIGQGNWNELWSKDKVVLVFDIGTAYTVTRENLIKLIKNRDNIYQSSNPILVLSHWDVDHYHFLLGLQDETIKSFSLFIYRGLIPNLTSRKVLGRFRILNKEVLLPIAAVSAKPLRSSKALQSYYLSNNKELLFFNAYYNSSRNKSGIGLAVRTKKTSVVLSGDYDYSQISDYMLPALNYKCCHYLIVPHHGGNAGKFKYIHSKLNKLKVAVISVGVNPYSPKHPHMNNINALIDKGFSVIRMDRRYNDYEIIL